MSDWPQDVLLESLRNALASFEGYAAHLHGLNGELVRSQAKRLGEELKIYTRRLKREESLL